MTDRIKDWAEMAADCAIDAANATDHDDAMKWIGLSVANALLAIHDTLAALKPEPVTYPWPMTGLTHTRGAQWDTADRYAANEAKQREAEPDPLDEDDHRDRLDRYGRRWRWSVGWWVAPFCVRLATVASLNDYLGPVTFAPDTTPQATGGDLSASQGESGHVEGPATDNAQNAILCPECDDHINTHNMEGCRRHRCDCPRTPEDVARALIADAVNTERDRLTDQLRATTNSVIAELDELAAWETHTDG